MAITKEPAKKNPSQHPASKAEQQQQHGKESHAAGRPDQKSQQNKNPSQPHWESSPQRNNPPQQKEKSSWK